MRTLLIAVLAVALVGCNYPLSPQVSMEACMNPKGLGGIKEIAASPASVSSKANSAATKVRSKIAARAEKRAETAVRDRPAFAEKKPASTLIEPKVEAPASGRTAETSDPVIVKAMTTIAAKSRDPASAEFIEMKRAIRKNMVGQPVDTICGRVKARIISDEEAGNWPFLYFVKNDAGFVVYGPAGSATETAYRNICSEQGTLQPPLESKAIEREEP